MSKHHYHFLKFLFHRSHTKYTKYQFWKQTKFSLEPPAKCWQFLYSTLAALLESNASHAKRRVPFCLHHFCYIMWPVARVQEKPNFGYKIRDIWSLSWTTYIHHPLVACWILSCVHWHPLRYVPNHNSAMIQHKLTFCTPGLCKNCTSFTLLDSLTFKKRKFLIQWFLQY